MTKALTKPVKAPVHSRARASLEAICVRIAGGAHINHACALERVPRQSFYDLLSSDASAAEQVAAARAEAAEYQRERLERVAMGEVEGGNANVLLHLLERAHPDEYRAPPTRAQNENTGANGGALEVAVRVMPIGDMKRIARQARQAKDTK